MAELTKKPEEENISKDTGERSDTNLPNSNGDDITKASDSDNVPQLEEEQMAACVRALEKTHHKFRDWRNRTPAEIMQAVMNMTNNLQENGELDLEHMAASLGLEVHEFINLCHQILPEGMLKAILPCLVPAHREAGPNQPEEDHPVANDLGMLTQIRNSIGIQTNWTDCEEFMSGIRSMLPEGMMSHITALFNGEEAQPESDLFRDGSGTNI